MVSHPFSRRCLDKPFPAQEYFGERALIKEEPRKATIKAVGEVECLVLERAAFMKLLLPSADRTFEEEMLNREVAAPVASDEARSEIRWRCSTARWQPPWRPMRRAQRSVGNHSIEGGQIDAELLRRAPACHCAGKGVRWVAAVPGERRGGAQPRSAGRIR